MRRRPRASHRCAACLFYSRALSVLSHMPYFYFSQAGRGAYALDDEPNQPTPIDGSGLGLRMCPLTLNEVPSTSSSSKQGFSLLSGRSTPPASSSRSSDNRGPAPTLFVQLSYFPVGTPQTQQAPTEERRRQCRRRRRLSPLSLRSNRKRSLIIMSSTRCRDIRPPRRRPRSAATSVYL